jgi:hypothetical protein
MMSGKIKIKAKYFIKVKAVMELLQTEKVEELILNNDFSFDYIINSITIDSDNSKFGYGWRLNGESAAV